MPRASRRPWLLPLVPLYAVGLRIADALRGRPRELTCPVISVGSLSAGGAGKTPVVLMLARLLAEHGMACDVLSRGYGRRSGVVEKVDPAGDTGRFGDEPMEMARAGLKVWVGADRFSTGVAAEDAAAREPTSQSSDVEHPHFEKVHLLDDGFQHRRLARALDLVLLTLEDVQDALLPAGNLREPLRALHRADVLVVRQEEAEGLRPWTDGRAVWVIRREMILPTKTPTKPVAFCGIARPDGFFAGLTALGLAMAGTVAFSDHSRYGPEEMERLVAAAEHAGANGFVTTAKDAVKLTEAMRTRLGPVAVVELQVTPLAPEAVWATIRTTIRARLREVLGARPA